MPVLLPVAALPRLRAMDLRAADLYQTTAVQVGVCGRHVRVVCEISPFTGVSSDSLIFGLALGYLSCIIPGTPGVGMCARLQGHRSSQ